MKILFFDIDGTLYDETTRIIPDSCFKAIKQAQQNGHLCFINTGRPICSIDDYILSLNMDGYVCGCGSYIEYKGEILYRSSIPTKKCKKIVSKLKEHKLNALLEGTDGVFYNPNNRHPRLDEVKENYRQCGFDVSKTWEDENINFDKMAVWLTEESNFEPFYNYIKTDFDVIKHTDEFYEVAQKHCSKATGIQFLLNYFHLDLDDTYVFGDSNNDLSMLSYVPCSIVMANGDEDVKKVASFVTKSVMDDGIEYALKHFQLI